MKICNGKMRNEDDNADMLCFGVRRIDISWFNRWC